MNSMILSSTLASRVCMFMTIEIPAFFCFLGPCDRTFGHLMLLLQGSSLTWPHGYCLLPVSVLADVSDSHKQDT